MKKLFLLSVIQACFLFSGQAQVLNVTNNEQLLNQWCWAGCSKTVLDYYGFFYQQCDIAEWVRTRATFHNFGTVNCCTDPNQGCNYWNYNYDSPGSIQDILLHFGNIQNIGIAAPLTLTEITTEIQNNHLFIIRWGFSSGGGHFVVGHGNIGGNIYFMDPMFGEGLHIGTYGFMLRGLDYAGTAIRTWTHTNKITDEVTVVDIPGNTNHNAISVYPNPFSYKTIIQSDQIFKDATLAVYNLFGQEVKQIKNISGKTIIFYRDNLPSGLYFFHLTQDNKTYTDKLVIADN